MPSPPPLPQKPPKRSDRSLVLLLLGMLLGGILLGGGIALTRGLWPGGAGDSPAGSSAGIPIPAGLFRDDVDVTLERWEVKTSLKAVSSGGMSFQGGPAPDITGPLQPGDGSVYLVCNVTVVSRSRQEPLYVGAREFSLVATDRKIYPGADPLVMQAGSFDLPELHWLAATMLRGATATGDVVFMVPPGALPVRIGMRR